MQTQTITVDDGFKLALRVYEPAAVAQSSVVIGGAVGVKQDYYRAFSSWLATQDYRVTTFDYRGAGESLPGTNVHRTRLGRRRHIDHQFRRRRRGYASVELR